MTHGGGGDVGRRNDFPKKMEHLLLAGSWLAFLSAAARRSSWTLLVALIESWWWSKFSW